MEKLTVRWGQEASRVGSSSSGSKSGLSLGGSVRNRLHAIWWEKILYIYDSQNRQCHNGNNNRWEFGLEIFTVGFEEKNATKWELFLSWQYWCDGHKYVFLPFWWSQDRRLPSTHPCQQLCSQPPKKDNLISASSELFHYNWTVKVVWQSDILLIFLSCSNLIKGCSLDLFSLQVGHGVHEVEANTALP